MISGLITFENGKVVLVDVPEVSFDCPVLQKGQKVMLSIRHDADGADYQYPCEVIESEIWISYSSNLNDESTKAEVDLQFLTLGKMGGE